MQRKRKIHSRLVKAPVPGVKVLEQQGVTGSVEGL